jgi:hypothetical protein
MSQRFYTRAAICATGGSKQFFLKKEPKIFCSSGPRASSPPQPMPQQRGSFLLLFFKKEVLP